MAAFAVPGALALGLTLSGCVEPKPSTRRVLVGDSITALYGQNIPTATLVGGSGEDNHLNDWSNRLALTPRADVVVLQDWHWYLAHDIEEWRAGFRNLLVVARRIAPRVVILSDGENAQFFNSLGAEVLVPPPPDYGDGIHYTVESSVTVAHLVVAATP